MKKSIWLLVSTFLVIEGCDWAFYSPIKVTPEYIEIDNHRQIVEFTTDVEYGDFAIMRQTNDEEMGERENADTCVIQWGDGYFAYGLSSDRKKFYVSLEENETAKDRKLEIYVYSRGVGSDEAILIQKSKPQ